MNERYLVDGNMKKNRFQTFLHLNPTLVDEGGMVAGDSAIVFANEFTSMVTSVEHKKDSILVAIRMDLSQNWERICREVNQRDDGMFITVAWLDSKGHIVHFETVQVVKAEWRYGKLDYRNPVEDCEVVIEFHREK